MMPPNINDEARQVLDALRERPMEGYALRSRTGMEGDKIVKAVQDLREQNLVMVKGANLTEKNLDELLVWIPPNAQGKVAFLLGSSMS